MKAKPRKRIPDHVFEVAYDDLDSGPCAAVFEGLMEALRFSVDRTFRGRPAGVVKVEVIPCHRE